MAETKASRLKALAELVSVPAFVVLSRDGPDPGPLDPDRRYMVRGSSILEDQVDTSLAGQLPTLGPLPGDGVSGAVATLFHDPRVEQVIVQEYAEAEASGVAFCFSADRMLVEYAAAPEGVTAGRVSPFVALLPSEIPRYQALQTALGEIWRRFGPCDVEFVGLRRPRFVQVRPITRETPFDEPMVRLKMGLQELSAPRWVENDICRMLAERMKWSRALADVYLSAIETVYRRYLKCDLLIPERPFIRIADQFFMDEALAGHLVAGWAGLARLAFRLPGLLAETRSTALSSLSDRELMKRSILMSFAHQLLGKREAMLQRERIREALMARLPVGAFEVDFHFDRPLADRIAFDPTALIWLAIGVRGSSGITVVPGDLESGPFFYLEKPGASIPEGVVLVTEQLYPEIGAHLDRIKGIICRYGAISSHLAILARERGIPLRIQADIERYRQ